MNKKTKIAISMMLVMITITSTTLVAGVISDDEKTVNENLPPVTISDEDDHFIGLWEFDANHTCLVSPFDENTSFYVEIFENGTFHEYGIQNGIEIDTYGAWKIDDEDSLSAIMFKDSDSIDCRIYDKGQTLYQYYSKSVSYKFNRVQ